MNFEQARHNMVEQQVRTWEVLNAEVLAVLEELPREDFVLPKYRKLAYADLMLPLGQAQVMMKPVVEGRLLQGLQLSTSDEVLEIGTGSGYLSACLAHLAANVLSVDIFVQFAERAQGKLEAMGFDNVTVAQGDVLGDWQPPHQNYDAVVVTGSMAQVSERLTAWVKPGGRLFAVLGQQPAMEAVVMTNQGQGRWLVDSLFETDLPRLIGAEDPAVFEF